MTLLSVPHAQRAAATALGAIAEKMYHGGDDGCQIAAVPQLVAILRACADPDGDEAAAIRRQQLAPAACPEQDIRHRVGEATTGTTTQDCAARPLSALLRYPSGVHIYVAGDSRIGMT